MEESIQEFQEACRLAPVGDYPNLALYLEEVKYAIDDLLGDWKALVKRAASEMATLVIEKECAIGEDILHAIEEMDGVAPIAKNCPRIVVIENPTSFQRDLLCKVERLRFLCKGSVTVFPYPLLTEQIRHRFNTPYLNADDMKEVIQPYYDFVLLHEPQWSLDGVFARCAIIVVLYSNTDGIFAWHLWDSIGEQWAFSGGDVNRREDQNLLGTAAREFNEENLGFGFADVRDQSVAPLLLPFIAGKSTRYPVQPYVYCKAKLEFFEATTVEKPYQFRIPANAVCASSNKRDFERLHSDPTARYVEHEWGAWGKIVFDKNALLIEPCLAGEAGPSSRTVRRENPLALQEHWPHIAQHFFGHLPEQEISSINAPVHKATAEGIILPSSTCVDSSADNGTMKAPVVAASSREEEVVQKLKDLLVDCAETSCSIPKLFTLYKKRYGASITQVLGEDKPEHLFIRHTSTFDINEQRGTKVVSLCEGKANEIESKAEEKEQQGTTESITKDKEEQGSRENKTKERGKKQAAGIILLLGCGDCPEKVVITCQRRRDNPESWELPKGGAEDSDKGNYQLCAARELIEETGVENEFVLTEISGYGKPSIHWHLARAEDESELKWGPIVDKDTVTARCVELAEAFSILRPDHKQLLRSVVADIQRKKLPWR